MRSRWLSGAAALLLALSALAPARAAEREVDAASVVPNAAPQAPAATSLPGGLGAAAVAAPQLIPNLSAPLAAPAAAPTAPRAGAAVTGAQAAVFGRRAQVPAQAPAALPRSAAAPAAAAPDSATSGAPALPASAVAASPSQARAPPAAGDAPASAALGSPSSEPLIRRAQEEARKLGSLSQTTGVNGAASGFGASVAGELADLNGRGWALLPAGTVVTPQRAANITAEIEKKWDRNPDSLFKTWELHPDGPKGWTRDVGGDAQGRGGARELVEDLTRRLQQALPGENIKLRDAQLRLRYNEQDNDVLHVDGGYLTATITLKGPGTLLYDMGRDGSVRELEAPVGAVALVTNIDRERATGVPGTVHSSPSPDKYRRSTYDGDRWILIVRYKREGQPAATEAERKALKQAHDGRRARAQRYRDAKNPSAAKPKKGFSLFGIKLGSGE